MQQVYINNLNGMSCKRYRIVAGRRHINNHMLINDTFMTKKPNFGLSFGGLC